MVPSGNYIYFELHQSEEVSSKYSSMVNRELITVNYLLANIQLIILLLNVQLLNKE